MGSPEELILTEFDLAKMSAEDLTALKKKYRGADMRLSLDFTDNDTAFLLRNPGNAQMLFDSMYQDETQDYLTPSFPTED